LRRFSPVAPFKNLDGGKGLGRFARRTEDGRQGAAFLPPLRAWASKN
jgi:hypothetical protein